MLIVLKHLEDLEIFPSGVVALNVDGRTFGSLGNAGFGCLIRDYMSCIHGCYGYIGVADDIKAEPLVVVHGLCLVLSLDHRHVLCYSDCLEAVSLFKQVITPYIISIVLSSNMSLSYC
ncbi:hypothetical protein VNO77_00613 [Canavalia gladiata]|uniref:RNase H type-1 domain-containing protein n=1 Tax=Canavalia gladiata TaxID=3824 RepID=A0AAN9MPR1_CANGL